MYWTPAKMLLLAYVCEYSFEMLRCVYLLRGAALNNPVEDVVVIDNFCEQ